jgi:hypothetical protein
MEPVRFSVVRHGAGWAVKHNDGYLGHVQSRAEAMKIARNLAAWAATEGQPAQFEPAENPVEPRTFTRGDT